MISSQRREALHIVEVKDRGALARFIEMPCALYADDPCWVQPLLFERLQHLDPQKNPYFDHAEVALWMAMRNDRAVGRISAQKNRMHLARHQDATGHFGFLEANDDPEVFDILLRTAEGWLHERQLKRVLGPFSLSINDESGLLVDGFDTPPMMMMGHAKPYYGQRLEEQGYTKVKDLIAYSYDLTQEPPPKVRRFMSDIKTNNDLHFRPARMSRFGSEVELLIEIFNDAWRDNWGFVPLTDGEVRALAKQLRPVVRGEDVWFGAIDGVTSVMAIGLANVNEAIADLRGRLLPLGWAKLLWRLRVRGTRTARLCLMGVRREYQRTPVGAALMLGVIDKLRTSHRARGTEIGELSWILEDNRPMRRVIEMFGAQAYKTYRIYGRDLP